MALVVNGLTSSKGVKIGVVLSAHVNGWNELSTKPKLLTTETNGSDFFFFFDVHGFSFYFSRFEIRRRSNRFSQFPVTA